MSQFQLPAHRDLFYGGGWHQAAGGTAATVSPSSGQELGSFAVAGAEDVDRAVAAARAGLAESRRVAPLERARALRAALRRRGASAVGAGDGAPGPALARRPGVAKGALIGSLNAGRAVMRAGADHIRPVLLELGGKNALIAFADADPGAVARAAVAGMNFGWCGQSCGSTRRALLHHAPPHAGLDPGRGRLKPNQPGP